MDLRNSVNRNGATSKIDDVPIEHDVLPLAVHLGSLNFLGLGWVWGLRVLGQGLTVLLDSLFLGLVDIMA